MRSKLRDTSEELVNFYYYNSPFCDGRDLDFDSRKHLFWERVKYLEGAEWQRWIPFIGTYRFFKDLRDGDEVLLREMHSKLYEGVNIFWNLGSSSVIINLCYNSFSS